LDGDSGEVKKSADWPRAELALRFQQVYGHEGDILYLDHAPSAPEITRAEIAVYRPPVASAYQKTIRLSVNGRPVSDKRLPYALREAMAGLIEIGRYPILQANLTVDVHAVDVNIHPQKKEIRWPANFSLASFLYSILRPQFEVRPESKPALPVENLQQRFFDVPTPSTENLVPGNSTSPTETIPLPPTAPRAALGSPTESRPDFSFSELRVIGEASASWIVCESPRGLIIVDQHAAHERINFERILTSRELIRAKPLLIPFAIPADLKWEGIESEFRRILEEFSFEFSDDGHQIIAIPEADRKIDWAEFLKEVLEDLRSDVGRVKRVEYLKMQLAASLSCHGSVRRGQRLSLEAAQALLKSMDEVQWGGLCPHGRPVWFEITNTAIEESFHR
jgi:DNA mismatch repair protein MutL